MEVNEANDKRAEELLEKGMIDAQQVMQNPALLNGILAQLEDKLKERPAIENRLSSIPLMTEMLKAWGEKEYTEVSDQVISRLIGAVLYTIKTHDLIWDDIPVVGIADDLAVMGLALRKSKQELMAFSVWKESRNAAHF